jgi:hypothetical protein
VYATAVELYDIDPVAKSHLTAKYILVYPDAHSIVLTIWFVLIVFAT